MFGNKWIAAIGAIIAGIGVGLGAIGAHALPDFLAKQKQSTGQLGTGQLETGQLDTGQVDTASIAKKLDNYEKAVRYQLYHALTIFAIGSIPVTRSVRGLSISALWMLLGIFLFCGGIYGIVFTTLATHWIVPFGGLSFIIGWTWLAISILRTNANISLS